MTDVGEAGDKSEENHTEDAAETKSSSSDDDSSISPDAEKPAEKTEVRSPDGGEPIVISVITPDGNISSEYSTPEDIDLNRPAQLSDDEVFTGWKEKKTVSRIESGEPVSGDVLTLTPVTDDIGGKKNTIYNNAVYTRLSSKEEFSVPVRVGGDTELCVLDLEVKYDPSVLEFVRFERTDGDATVNCIKEENRILISFVTYDNIKADTLLTDIVFRPLADSYTESQFYYTIKDIYRWNNDAQNAEETEYSITAGNIVMY